MESSVGLVKEYLYSSCYIGNLCEAISLVVQSSVRAEVFFIADNETLRFRDWMTQRLRVGHYRVPTLSIPRALAWPFALFTENGWNYLPLKGDPPLVREAVRAERARQKIAAGQKQLSKI